VSYQRGTSYAERFLTGFTEASAALGLATVAHPGEPGPDGVRDCLAAIDADPPGVTGLVVHNQETLRLVLDGRRTPPRQLLAPVLTERDSCARPPVSPADAPPAA
jgi:hypothetical protein